MRIFVLMWVLLNTVGGLSAAFAEPSAEKKSVEERLAELEANQSLQYIQFSGFLISSYDNIAVDETYPNKATYSDLGYLRLRFSLNIDAEINPQIKVYSRLTTTKFMNTWSTQGGDPYHRDDIEEAHSYSSSHLLMEKAYVDLSSPDSLWTLSVGRLPTVNGTPAHLLDMLPRQGTYPSLTFNAPLDGLAMTYRLESYLPSSDHEWAVRAIYTPFSSLYWGGPDKFLRPPTEDSNGTTPTGNELNTLSHMFSLQSDYTVKDLEYSETMGLIWQYYRTGSMHVTSGAGTSNLKLQTSGHEVSWEANGLLDTGLDISLNYAYIELRSQGLLAPGLGAGTDQDHGEFYGGRSLLAARYRFKDWALGGERIDSDRYAYSYASAAEDLTGFYLTPGTGHHLYVVTKFMSLVTLRAGYRQQDLRSYFPGLGPVQDTDRSIKTFYITLRTDF